MLTTAEHAEAQLSSPNSFGGTYGGNAVACAAALATLDVIEDEGLLENTRRRGEQLMAGLESIAADHPGVIGEIRGRGLMVGVEFAPESCPGYAGIAGRLSQACLARHMLLLPCGTRQTVRFAPPLVVTEAEVDAALATFAEALAEVAAGS